MMIQVVMMANRTSPIVSFLAAGGAVPPESKGTVLAGEELGEFLEPLVFGLHFNTASTDALQGCTCNGYENMTRMTIAAFAIVDATEGTSSAVLAVN
jgi:hypothetical protein